MRKEEEIIVQWKAKDGKVFDTEEGAKEYEEALERKEKIDYIDFDNIGDNKSGYYFLDTLDDMIFIIDHNWGDIDTKVYIDRNILFYKGRTSELINSTNKTLFNANSFARGWYTLYFKEGGDFGHELEVHTPDYTMKYIFSKHEEIKKIISRYNYDWEDDSRSNFIDNRDNKI